MEKLLLTQRVSLVLLLTTSCLALKAAEENCTGETFDYFAFAQQWPQSVCINATINHTHKCKKPKYVNTFTVHGLWPTCAHSAGPGNCSGHAFDMNKIQNLTNDLQKYWPNLYFPETHNKTTLWIHEWMKHGICATVLSSFSNEYKYFYQGIHLNRKVDILQFLQKAGITPSDTIGYTHPAIVKAITNVTGGITPILQCTHKNNTQFLMQVQICLNKTTLDYTSCNPPRPHMLGSYMYCNKTIPVHLPL